MLSLMGVYRKVCTKPHTPPLIAVSRHKDVLTAVKYLASAHGTTPETLALTPTLEATYRGTLRTYLEAHQKGYSTIRNTLQSVAQLLKAFHTLDQTPLVRPSAPALPGARAARKHVREQSPYRPYLWLRLHPYELPHTQWPAEIAARWNTYVQSRMHDVRATSFGAYTKRFSLYVGYQLLCSPCRLSRLPESAQAKLKTKAYTSQLREITDPPILTSWDELFEPARLNSYITWSSWRCWPWHDEALREKTPHRPSTTALNAAVTLEQLAKRTGHPRHAELNTPNKTVA